MTVMVDDVITKVAPVSPPEARALAGRWWWRVLAAIGSGLVLLLAFPVYDLWFAAPFGVALLVLATYRRGFWAGAGLGLICGLSLLIPLLRWAGGYVGPVWLFLPVGESAYLALLGGLSALATPVLTRSIWTWPVVTGALWVLEEALRDRTPFGGFPWGRLAFSQSDSPLLGLAAIGGAPLVTFGVAAVGGALALGATVLLDPAHPIRVRLRDRVPPGAPPWRDPRAVAWSLLVLALVALTALPPLAPSLSGGATETVRVAVVQGNVPRLGLNFNAQRRAVLDNHVKATLALADRVRAGTEPRPDLVVWPENASDIDPILNVDARHRIDEAVRGIGAPILVGGLLEGPGPKVIRNVGIVWDPDTGPGETYVKRHPVPFAEYMPIRSIVRMITDKADLVRTDFVAGPTPGVMRVGPAVVGDVICFEVAYDDVVRDTVTGGAQLLVVQTNNATFDEAEARQQLAMVRLRAVEHGRPALMASTVGVSAFVDETGNVYDATLFNAPWVIARDVMLRDGRTMATRLGVLPELALAGVAVWALAAAVVIRRSRRDDLDRTDRARRSRPGEANEAKG